MTKQEKLEALKELMQKQSEERIIKDHGSIRGNEQSFIVSVKEGKKYTKIDRGGSGVYMVDEKGDIYGIKAYGVIHRGHYFGNLDTISLYNWGGYRAVKVA